MCNSIPTSTGKLPPEFALAKLLQQELNVDIDPGKLRIFIRLGWDRAAPLLHAIHDDGAPEKTIQKYDGATLDRLRDLQDKNNSPAIPAAIAEIERLYDIVGTIRRECGTPWIENEDARRAIKRLCDRADGASST